MKLTAQQVFDNALFGLRKQRIKSLGKDHVCMYRGTTTKGETLRCGIGFSVDDDIGKMMDESDGPAIASLVASNQDVRSIFGHLNLHFLRELQAAHDETLASDAESEDEVEVVRCMSYFETAMSNIADTYKLNYTKD